MPLRLGSNSGLNTAGTVETSRTLSPDIGTFRRYPVTQGIFDLLSSAERLKLHPPYSEESAQVVLSSSSVGACVDPNPGIYRVRFSKPAGVVLILKVLYWEAILIFQKKMFGKESLRRRE